MSYPDIPDPLREEFDRLERQIAVRETWARQKRCQHRRTADMTAFGGQSWRLCLDCGLKITPAW